MIELINQFSGIKIWFGSFNFISFFSVIPKFKQTSFRQPDRNSVFINFFSLFFLSANWSPAGMRLQQQFIHSRSNGLHSYFIRPVEFAAAFSKLKSFPNSSFFLGLSISRLIRLQQPSFIQPVIFYLGFSFLINRK